MKLKPALRRRKARHERSVILPNGLTERQAEVLAYWRRFTLAHLRPPTVREAMVEFDWSSMNAWASHVRALIRKGFLRKSEHGRSHCYTVASLPCPHCGGELVEEQR